MPSPTRMHLHWFLNHLDLIRTKSHHPTVQISPHRTWKNIISTVQCVAKERKDGQSIINTKGQKLGSICLFIIVTLCSLLFTRWKTFWLCVEIVKKAKKEGRKKRANCGFGGDLNRVSCGVFSSPNWSKYTLLMRIPIVFNIVFDFWSWVWEMLFPVNIHARRVHHPPHIFTYVCVGRLIMRCIFNKHHHV